MTEALPVLQLDEFREDMIDLPSDIRDGFRDVLINITKEDIKRNKFEPLRGKLRIFRKVRKGKYRAIFVYCRECYTMFNRVFGCVICNDDFEKIIAFCILKRKHNYRKFQKRFGKFF